MDWRRSAKETKNEVKIIGESPLFPRLHVNDAEKGGPKAPPRNKMALYEQLTVPSRRFNSGSSCTSPPPQSNGCSLVPSTSSSLGHGNERSVFTQFCNSSAPAHSAGKVHSYSFRGYELNAAIRNVETKSMKPANYHSSSATVHLPSATTRNQPFSVSNFDKSSYIKKVGDDNEPRVPPGAQLGLVEHLKTAQHVINGEKLTCPSSSLQLQTSFQKQFRKAITTDLKSRQGVMNQIEEGHSVRRDSAPVLLGRNKIFACTSLSQSDREYYSDPVKRARFVDDLNRQHNLHHRIVTMEQNVICREHVLVQCADGIIQGNATIMEGDSCLRLSKGDGQGSLDGARSGGDHECGSFRVSDIERKNDVSETSILDSASGLMITPDDVVEVIGENKFLKARKTIVNQQRVFAVQVFELHRLIKVQRLISESPRLIFECVHFEDKPFLKACPIKKLPTENVLEPPPTIVKPKDDSQKQKSRTESAEIMTVGKRSLNQPQSSNIPANQSQSNNIPATSVAAGLTPWCFGPSPGNQWLVPVMSPSEGLIYKPYNGPCPPTMGSADILNAAFGVSPSHTLGQTYFQQCVFPFMNRSICGSGIEQISMNTFQLVKGSELQGSSASSPSETVQGDALPLFPTAPALEVPHTAQTHSCNQQARVIKVVPHNPKLATESAARIFQSIQEGRKNP